MKLSTMPRSLSVPLMIAFFAVSVISVLQADTEPAAALYGSDGDDGTHVCYSQGKPAGMTEPNNAYLISYDPSFNNCSDFNYGDWYFSEFPIFENDDDKRYDLSTCENFSFYFVGTFENVCDSMGTSFSEQNSLPCGWMGKTVLIAVTIFLCSENIRKVQPDTMVTYEFGSNNFPSMFTPPLELCDDYYTSCTPYLVYTQ